MPGPPTINWYRADLRSPLPRGLSRPADHLYQSLLFFFPSPFPILLSTKQGAVYWLSCRMDSRQNGKAWQVRRQVNCFSCIDGTGTMFKNTQGHVRLSDKYMRIIHLCPFVDECLSAHAVLFMSSPLTNKLTLEKQESFFPALCSSCWPSLKYAPFSLLLTLPFLLVILSEDRLYCICSMLLLIGPFGPR